MERYNQVKEKIGNHMPFLLLVYCLIIILWVYRSTANEILTLWLKFDESMGHGLLVLLSCLFLLYKGNVWRYAQTCKPEFYGFIPLVITSMAWGITTIVGINIISQLLLPILFLLAVLVVLGREFARHILVPVMFIYFAIPIWDYLNNVLLHITVIVVQELVRRSNITAYIEGSSIFLSTGEILIASGCSGLRYIIVGSFLSVLSAYLYHTAWLVRFLIILMNAVLAILANWIRVYGIIMIAHVSEMQSPLVKDHETLGWIIFMIFMIPLFYINYRYSIVDDRSNHVNVGKRAVISGKRQLVAAILLIPSVYAGQLMFIQAEHEVGYRLEEIVNVPNTTGEWMLSSVKEDNVIWTPHFRVPKNYIFQAYRNKRENINVTLFILPYYKEVKNGDILPYFASIYDPTLWSLNRSTEIEVVADGKDIRLKKNFLTNKRTQEEIIMLSHYNVGGLTTSSYNIAKLYQIPAVLGKKPYAIITVVVMQCNKNCDAVDKYLYDYINTNLNRFSHINPGV
jgi:EpsI family protein